MERRIMLGCIADDFTGASDAASFLVKGGMKTILFNGIPDKEFVKTCDCDAIVIAMKTRTQETKSAVEECLEAVRWLKDMGAEHIYEKYCSTFDSTREGNIGPISDALLEVWDLPYTILCPALPVNGRQVKGGRLYVNGIPLDESPMKNHPLTPMWDSEISELMKPQSKYPCVKMSSEQMELGTKMTDLYIRAYMLQNHVEHCYVIPDYANDQDAQTIVSVFGRLGLLTGGSGLMEELAKKYLMESCSERMPEKKQMTGNAKIAPPATEGSALLLAGSCSKATLGQIACFQNHGGISFRMSPADLLSGEQTVEDLWEHIAEKHGESVLVYSSDKPEKVKEAQKAGREKVAYLLEGATAELARKAVEAGYRRIIVAGGETSGAVTKGFGFDSYEISESVAPGVPVMIPLKAPEVRLVLKSGNFGQEDFFERAMNITLKRI